MRSILVIPTLALCLLANIGTCAEITTCQDVIEAQDQVAMRQTILPLRDVGFKAASVHEAQVLYQALQDKGVHNSLQAVLEQYESSLIPARTGAAEEFDNLVSGNGGLAATITLLCHDRKTDMIGFFSNFYHLYLYRPHDSQGQHDNK